MTTEFIEKNVGILPFLWYSIKAHECLAQLGEHFLDVEGVMGSSPLALTLYCYGNPHKYAVFFCLYSFWGNLWGNSHFLNFLFNMASICSCSDVDVYQFRLVSTEVCPIRSRVIAWLMLLRQLSADRDFLIKTEYISVVEPVFFCHDLLTRRT